MLRDIKGTQRLPRLLAFRVDGTGTASILEGKFDATLTDTGTGDYLLTFAKPFARLPVVLISPIGAAGDIFATIGTVSATAVQILGWDGSDGVTAKDMDFHVQVIGFDSVDPT